MESLVLHVATISLCLGNELKIFPSTEVHKNVGPPLKCLLLEHTTLVNVEEGRYKFAIVLIIFREWLAFQGRFD